MRVTATLLEKLEESVSTNSDLVLDVAEVKELAKFLSASRELGLSSGRSASGAFKSASHIYISPASTGFQATVWTGCPGAWRDWELAQNAIESFNAALTPLVFPREDEEGS